MSRHSHKKYYICSGHKESRDRIKAAAARNFYYFTQDDKCTKKTEKLLLKINLFHATAK